MAAPGAVNLPETSNPVVTYDVLITSVAPLRATL